jgi:hypothetical protein
MVNDSLLLNAEQIAAMKFKVGQRLVEDILHNNPSLKLFGGAVRDKILHDYTKTSYCPQDYDFCTRSGSGYRNAIDFVQRNCGHVRVWEKKDQDPNYPFEVTTFSIDLFAVFLTEELSIKIDIVLHQKTVNCDFDVNALSMGTSCMELINNGYQDVYHGLRNTFAFIEKKQATLCYKLSKDEKIQAKEKTILSCRALKLIRQGWKVYRSETCHELMQDGKESSVCKDCDFPDSSILCTDLRNGDTLECCFECFDLFWESQKIEVVITEKMESK